MPNWDENSPQLRTNIKNALESARDSAKARVKPSLDLPRQWQAQIMKGLTATDGADPSWYGKFRGEPGQDHIGVRIGAFKGTLPHLIDDELQAFITFVEAAIDKFDQEIFTTDQWGNILAKELDRSTVSSIIGLMARVHGEWVRIHPFANGNGRTARLWANWIAMRFGLPPFIKLRPRPGGGYEQASEDCMKGNWKSMRRVFEELLDAMANELLP
jgi:hypothetical protein